MTHRITKLDPGTTKSGEARTLVLEGELLELIEQQWQRRAVAEIPNQSPALICPSVFHRRDRPIKDFREAWDRMCKVVGL